MGTCGCNEIQNARGFKVGDKILAVEVYPGCELCNTGIAVMLYLFTPEEAEDYLIAVDDNAFEPDRWGNIMVTIPLIEPDDLPEALSGLPPMEHYGNIQDWLSDNGRELLQNAICRCRAEPA